MGNEQHRFFLHAVAMIGGEPLAKVDMEAYMCAHRPAEFHVSDISSALQMMGGEALATVDIKVYM